MRTVRKRNGNKPVALMKKGGKAKKKVKKFKDFIKDLVFNNPRADRQFGKMDGDFNDPDWLDRNMLYDQSPSKGNG